MTVLDTPVRVDVCAAGCGELIPLGHMHVVDGPDGGLLAFHAHCCTVCPERDDVPLLTSPEHAA